jgi:hypothetical protein
MAPNSARRSKLQPNPHAAAVEFILKPWLKRPGRVCPSAVSGRQCFLKVPSELHGQVLSWLTGYMAVEDVEPVIDFDRMAESWTRIARKTLPPA